VNTLVLAVMCMFFAPAAPAPAPVTEPEAQLMSVDQQGTALACSGEGDECLTHGAPGCCRGLRCVGSVCKK
jgi:hypothetical protein